MATQAEDILSDARTLLGCEAVEDPGYVQYGPLRLTVAPKVNSSCWLTIQDGTRPPSIHQSVLFFCSVLGGQGGWSQVCYAIAA